jgi:hypothetical protein
MKDPEESANRLGAEIAGATQLDPDDPAACEATGTRRVLELLRLANGVGEAQAEWRRRRALTRPGP